MPGCATTSEPGRHRRLLLKALAVAPVAGAAASGAAAAAAAPFPRDLVDTLGRPLRIGRPPERIVVVFPSNVEIAYALGLEARIAAIGGRVNWPPAARDKPTVGGPLGYSAEAVAAFRPDLIVLTPSHMSALNLIAPFERLGVPVLVLQHPDLASIFRNIRLLGQATGNEANAVQVVSAMQRQLDALRGRLRHAAPRRVFLETGAAGNANLQTVGRHHYANDALHWAGGENIFADLAGSQQVSSEAVFLRDPDVIIALRQTDDLAGARRAIAQRPGWSTLRAVRSGRLVVLGRGHKLIPGPRQIEAVADYARALHPEAFDE